MASSRVARCVEQRDEDASSDECACLTAEQANDFADTFSSRFGGMNTTCQRTQYAKSEQKLTWRLESRGQFNMDSAAEVTFFGPLRYTAVGRSCESCQ